MFGQLVAQARDMNGINPFLLSHSLWWYTNVVILFTSRVLQTATESFNRNSGSLSVSRLDGAT